jgi:hypothetical protein
VKALRLLPDECRAATIAGRILTRDLRDDAGRIAFPKGHVFSPLDADRLATLAWEELHLIVPDAGEVHETAAGQRLANAIAGEGVRSGESSAGHWPLFARARGIVAVNASTLAGINAIGGLCAYSVLDGQVVDVGDCVARAKIIPLVISEPALVHGESVARASRGAISVRAFRSLRVGAVVQESLGEDAMARARAVLAEKVTWLGGELLDPFFVPADAGRLASALRQLVDAGAGIVTVAGSRVMDPLDPMFGALAATGAEIVRMGMPAHPGSLCWVARLGSAALLGMPSCGLFSRATVFDVLLAQLFTGDAPDAALLATMGHGGLFSRDLAFRFPPYRRMRDRGEVA